MNVKFPHSKNARNILKYNLSLGCLYDKKKRTQWKELVATLYASEGPLYRPKFHYI